MSDFQDSLAGALSKLCCCFHIEFGGFVVGITRLVLHLARVMVAIIILVNGSIKKGGGGDSNTEHPENTTGVPGPGGETTTTVAAAALKMEVMDKSHTKLTEAEIEEMDKLLFVLALYWITYYSIYFFISFVYVIGIKMEKWWMMMPMLLMAAVDIVAAALIQSPGIVFAHVMNDPYIKPAIGLTFVWEICVAVFGLYLFFVIWGSLLAIKKKKEPTEE